MTEPFARPSYNGRYSKPQQKHRLGTVSKNMNGSEGGGGGRKGGFNRFYVATTPDPSSVVVYTTQLFSPREGFLIHQCNISENIIIKRIQR